MDRLIEVKVRGSHLTQDNNVAGVRGEGNVTALRIEFDEGWDNFAKTVIFFNSHGENPVKRILTADLLEDIADNTRIYICPIPSEPLEYDGKMEYVIEGYHDSKRQRAITSKLNVLFSPDTDNAGEPIDPTPSQAEQLQGEIENLLGNVAAEADRAENAANTAAEEAVQVVKGQAEEIATQIAEEVSRKTVEDTKAELEQYVTDAEEAAKKAENASFNIHASSHSKDGIDPITPAMIGAVSTEDFEEHKNAKITAEKLEDGAVTEKKLSDGSVTTAKLADEAITEDKVEKTFLAKLLEGMSEDEIIAIIDKATADNLKAGDFTFSTTDPGAGSASTTKFYAVYEE